MFRYFSLFLTFFGLLVWGYDDFVTDVEGSSTFTTDASFSSFTGKVVAQKVYMRINPDIKSRVIQELYANDLLIVTGEKGEFYAVEPPSSIKGYVFRSFVLDGVVEGDRVNVRLEPSLEAPVIGMLASGDRIEGEISSLNNRWYEITLPLGVQFFVAKEYIHSVGGPEVKIQRDKRRSVALHFLDKAALLTKAEMKKPFSEIEIDRIRGHYQTLLKDYAEFSDLCDQAKEALQSLQADYTQKRIAYLEKKAEGKEFIGGRKEEGIIPFTKIWEPIEESLYSAWASQNQDGSLEEFYEEERKKAVAISGVIEPYTDQVKKKPGDFILKNKNIPVAYLYSTLFDLNDFKDKEVILEVAQRDNNHFAFPAYFVLSVESPERH